jgi:hypothetical protein
LGDIHSSAPHQLANTLHQVPTNAKAPNRTHLEFGILSAVLQLIQNFGHIQPWDDLILHHAWHCIDVVHVFIGKCYWPKLGIRTGVAAARQSFEDWWFQLEGVLALERGILLWGSRTRI